MNDARVVIAVDILCNRSKELLENFDFSELSNIAWIT